MTRPAPVAAAGLAVLLASSSAGLETPPGPPRLSPPAQVAQVVGVSTVQVTYDRPAVAGRVIWGEAVPWKEVWRPGADEPATISLGDDVEVAGEPLAAGSYLLFTIPDPEEWVLIFQSETEGGGTSVYDPEREALRIRVRPRRAPFQERLLIYFPSVGADSVTVAIAWEEVLVPFEVSVDLERTVLERARAFVAAASPQDGPRVWEWANYLYRNDLGTEDALGWAAALAASSPMYWTHALHARLLARSGRTAEAAAAAERALAHVEGESEQGGEIGEDARLLASEAEAWRGVEPPAR
ncbi:MAG: DUF2911 domain-containing protein [Thermoanaerobaculia bacterium]|nr:DUF2911 domain-containing protein [Thermoanaerobaculia bacterium]